MNYLNVQVKQWTDPGEATEGVNKFIKQCNGDGVEILDIKTHVTEIEDFMTYVFIFKLKTIDYKG